MAFVSWYKHSNLHRWISHRVAGIMEIDHILVSTLWKILQKCKIFWSVLFCVLFIDLLASWSTSESLICPVSTIEHAPVIYNSYPVLLNKADLEAPEIGAITLGKSIIGHILEL